MQLYITKYGPVCSSIDYPAFDNATLQDRTSFNTVGRFWFQENQRNQESKGQHQETKQEGSETFNE
jgi:hypothetical protein